MKDTGAAATRRQFLAASAALALCAATPLAAHRLRMAMTTIVWRADRGLLEITHRLHTGDAELALAGSTADGQHDDDDHGANREGYAALSPENARQRARIALYVGKRFGLVDPDKGAIDLTTLGAEVDGDNVLVYQEVKLPALPPVLRVRNEILTDVFRDQTNHVNFHVGEQVFSLEFRDRAKPQQLRLDRPERGSR